MERQEITEQIIGCSYRVYNKMGFGFLESVYERCLCIVLERTGLKVECQKPIQVFYDGYVVGEYVTDVLVEDTVLVELKSVRTLVIAHEVQLVNYLTATHRPFGLLINFGEEGVEVRRKYRQSHVREERELYDTSSDDLNGVSDNSFASISSEPIL